MRINHNIASLNTYRMLTLNNTLNAKSLEKLSSGLRINRAGDDAAGLAISEKMRGQIRGLEQAARNAQDGISLIQTAEGALNEIHSILQRMRELAAQSANDTNTSVDRNEIQKEVNQLAQEITRIANNTEFNTQKLLNGAIQSGNIGELTFHIGANESQNLSLSINAMDAASLGVAAAYWSVSVDTGATAISSAVIDGARGSGIVAGANLTVTAADNTGTKASGTATIGTTTKDLTITANAVGPSLNGVKIVFGADSDNNITTSWDAGTNTLTVTADWDNNNSKAPSNLAQVQTAINTGLEGAGFVSNAVTLSVSGTFTASEFANAGTITLSGGTAADSTQTIVTIDDGTNKQTVAVSDSATSVKVTSGTFQGLVIYTSNVSSMSGALTINQTLPTAAQFSGGALTQEARALAGIDVSTQSAANSAITTIQQAIETVSAERSKLGALQNRLEHTINNLGTASENLTAAESRIRDVDMAKEMMEFTKMNILTQAATAMLAQANMQPQAVLQLLGR